jgi:hypothetical protein
MVRGAKFASVIALTALVFSSFAVSASADGYPINPIPAANRQVVWATPEYDQQAIAASNRVNYGLAFTGGLETRMQGSNIRAFTSDGSQSRMCDTSLACLNGTYTNLQAIGAIDLCANTHQAPCVESLEYKLGTENFRTAQYAFTVDPSPTAADIQQVRTNGATYVQQQSGWSSAAMPGVPGSASGPLVFKMPGATNAGGTDTYAIESAFSFSSAVTTANGVISQFHTSVIPVVDDPTSHCEATWYDYKLGSLDMTNGVSCAEDQKAYFSSKSIGWAARFPDNIALRLKLRLPQSIGGWLQGRAESPSVQIASQADGSNLVTIDAAPTSIPTTATTIALYDPANADLVASMGLNDSFWNQWRSQDGSSPGVLYPTGDGWTPYRGGSTLIGKVASAVGNKAKGYISAWEFKQLNSNGPCMNDRSSLQGLLTTNAMTYQPDLPAMNDGFLSYSVAGLHYDSNGNVFQGTYNYIMRDSVARCLYGFKSNAPISGTVSVTSSDGQENVANTTVTDDGTWLKLSAQGFTFSSPTIQVKLSQEGSQASAPAPATSAATKSITCVKGKVTKRVTGTSPKCPAGFKKK